MSSIIREIAVVRSSTLRTQRRQMRRKPNAALLVRDYTPVTPDRPVVGRPVSNGNDVTLSDAAVRLGVLVHLERGAELWRENWALVDAIGRGGGLVEARFVVEVERSRRQISLKIFAVRTRAIADLVNT